MRKKWIIARGEIGRRGVFDFTYPPPQMLEPAKRLAVIADGINHY